MPTAAAGFRSNTIDLETMAAGVQVASRRLRRLGEGGVEVKETVAESGGPQKRVCAGWYKEGNDLEGREHDDEAEAPMEAFFLA